MQRAAVHIVPLQFAVEELHLHNLPAGIMLHPVEIVCLPFEAALYFGRAAAGGE